MRLKWAETREARKDRARKESFMVVRLRVGNLRMMVRG